MKLAILGGSFNPVHIGHIALANQAIEQFGYDRVSFVPTFNPPHKKLAQGASDEDRCAMLKLAIADNLAFNIETCEIERQGVSYTIDTINHLYSTYSHSLEGKIGIIIGADLIKDFHLWKDVRNLVEMADVLVAYRTGGASVDDFSFSFTYKSMENALIDISSHQIRTMIKNGKEWENYVSKNVYKYATEKHLYI